MEPASADVVARRLYAALGARDRSVLTRVVDDASVLHVAGASGIAGDYQGREPITGLLCRMTEVAGGSLRYGAGRLLTTTDEHIVLAGRASATRRGRRLNTDVTLAVYVVDGLVREGWLSFADQATGDRFWS